MENYISDLKLKVSLFKFDLKKCIKDTNKEDISNVENKNDIYDGYGLLNIDFYK